MAKKVEQKEIKFVQLEFHGQKEPLINIHLLMLTWLQVNIVKTLTTVKVKRKSNGGAC